MLVLLDRDGVINEDLPQGITHPDQLRLIPKSAAAIARLNEANIKVAVVTNQSVIGKGLISEQELTIIHERLKALLAEKNACVDAIYHCPDHPDHPTPMRKPAPGMLLQALHDFHAKPETTVMVGDALRDIQAAQAAGCGRYLVRTGKGKHTAQDAALASCNPVKIVADLSEMVDDWLQQMKKGA